MTRRTAKTPRAAKQKGRRAVLAVRDLLMAATGLPEGDFFVTTTSVPGVDIHLSPAAVKRFPFAIEVKAQEALNIWAALKQATTNADAAKLSPILFFTRNNEPAIYVALKARDLLTFL